MKKWTSEIVQLCTEDGVPVALLIQNGESHFYRIGKASKEFVADVLGVNEVKTDEN